MSAITSPILTDDTFRALLNQQNMILAGILSAQVGGVQPTSWKTVQYLVRAGLAKQVFAIGDQLVCNKGDVKLVWDIIGIDHDVPADKQFTHSMTLQLHDCLAGMQYDGEEAFYYAEEGLAAGTYHITFGIGWGTNVVSGKSYQFTLANPVPAGGQLVGFYRAPDTAPSTWKVSSYSGGASSDAIETVSVTEGTGGTLLIDSWTAAVNGNVNSLHRAAYGSNNWMESAMRQWINSDKVAGSVWTPQTKFDRPPTWAASTAGFLNGIDADFLEVIGETEKVTCRNTVTGGGGSDITTDKFFLLSRREVYAGNEVSSVIEGEPYPYYSDYSDLSAAGTGNDTNRIKYRNGSPQYWWLRTPTPGFGFYVRVIDIAGNLDFGNAHYGGRVAPACNII